MKNIALVVDTDNWVFYNIANDIKDSLKNYFNFKIIPIANLNNNIINVLMEADDCDLIHFFWRGVLLQIGSNEYKNKIEKMGLELNEFNKKYLTSKIITFSIPDHLYIDNNFELTKKIISEYHNYYVSSNKLLDIYNNLDINHKPYDFICDGVNLNKFYLKNKSKFKNIGNRKIIIGWAGNSSWHSDEEDFKGVNTILKPAIKDLINEGYNIEIRYADRNINMIPYDDMINFYNDIDIYVCTSKNEGTPRTVLEAMACGNIIVSTNVGVVCDVLGNEQSKFILEERSKEALKKKIIYLLNNKDLFEKLSNENLEQIKKWDTNIVFNKLKDFYYNVFELQYQNYINKLTKTNMEKNEKIQELEENISRLDNYNNQLERENNKCKLQIKALNLEQEYMKLNIYFKDYQLRKINNSRSFKLLKKLWKLKNKILFWRKK